MVKPALCVSFASTFLLFCSKSPPEPPSVAREPPPAIDSASLGSSSSAATASSKPMAAEPAVGAGGGASGDPLQGVFTLADAEKAVPGGVGKGPLVAQIVTSNGALDCKLFADKAPNTVANFVGLATGARPFRDPKTGQWVKRPAYDGTIFHRIIKGFMIQGGDPAGNGSGEPGYVIADELWPGAVHDRAGLLCMANRGKDTNGAQFFITDAAAKHLDSGYTIFGECSPEAVVHAIASVDVAGESPKTPVAIKSVKILRGKAGK